MCAHLPRASGDSCDIWTRHSWNSHGTRGHSGMAPVASEGLGMSQLLQIPAVPSWQCHRESKVLHVHSLCLPFPKFPFWDLSLLWLKPLHPSPPFLECRSQPLPVPCPGCGNGLPPAPRSTEILAGGHEEPGAGCDCLKPPQEVRAAAGRAVCPHSHSWADIWPAYVLYVPDICSIDIYV